MNNLNTVEYPNYYYGPGWFPQPQYVPVYPQPYYYTQPLVWNIFPTEEATVLKARIFDLEIEVTELKKQIKELQDKP